MDASFILQDIFIFLLSPSMLWVCVTFIILFILKFIFLKFPDSKTVLVLELIYEKWYVFFEDILGKEHKNILPYIVSLFFLLLIINLLGVVSDFIAPIFGISEAGKFYMAEYFQTPSADLNFNIALAAVSIVLLLVLQFTHFGYKKTFYNYIPIFGKGYLSYHANKKSRLSVIIYPIVKSFDIILSIFLSLLDIVGLVAKIISLSFRLFGNIISGWVLLVLLVGALSDFSQKMTAFLWGINFPILFPLILYAQSTLVACIQAMVFALLVAIFIRVSQLEAS